jgi:hypothetical protein
MSDIQEETFTVISPSGAPFIMLTQDEVDYFEDRSTRYVTTHVFHDVSDLQDVDRVIMMELMIWRWSNWLSMGADYYGQHVEERELRDYIKNYSLEVRQLKKLLGIDKAARDREKGESFPVYLEKLLDRAKQFGVMREKQLDKALILFNELKALVTLHDNCDEIERKENNCELDDIFEWIRTIAIPEYDLIDSYFQEHQQRAWIREQ